MKILIVDDREENLYLLETLLKGKGYEVVLATNGAEALEKLRGDNFDLIISDILMPVMDGFQLCREYKSDNMLKKIPFVFYTATYTDKRDEEFALSLGADKFIVKPMEPEQFTEIIESVFKNSQKGLLHPSKVSVKKEEAIYLKEYNEHLVRKLEHKMLEVEEDNRFLYTVIESLNYPFFVLNPDDYTIKMANSAACHGRSFEGLTCYALTHKRDKPCTGKHPCPIEEIKKTRKPAVTEHVHFDKKNRPIIVEVHGFPVFDDKGDISQILVYSVDITERKKAEEELEKYKTHLEELVKTRTEELEASNKELEAFSYSVSHDLRAPLRNMDGFSQALLEDYAEKIDPQAKDYLTRIRTNSQRMAQLIDDILKLSRMTRAEIIPEKINLSQIATSISVELQRNEQGRKVEFIIQDNISIDGDKNLFYLVFQNLLENAWKFTAKNESSIIEFGTKVHKNKITYFVRDNGVGFDMNYVDKLFKAFQRLHSTKEFSGTGIGLAIVQSVINRHGGRVWAEGEINNGTTIYFTM